MARYIDADVLHIQMENLYEHHIEMKNYSADGAVADCLDLLDNSPTADVAEVKHGYWKDRYGNKYDNQLYECSVCGEKALYEFYKNDLDNWAERQKLTPVCPHCFAKMDIERNDT